MVSKQARGRRNVQHWYMVAISALCAVMLVPLVPRVAAAELNEDGDRGVWVTNGRTYDITQIDERVFAGGAFNSVSPRARGAQTPQARLAAFHADTGVWDDTFRPAVNGTVRTLAPSSDGKRLFVGGFFTDINGSGQRYIVALDAVTGEVDPNFQVVASGPIYDIEVDGNHVYLGGSFNNLNGVVNASRAARVDATTGEVDRSWKPRPDARVEAIDIPPSGGRVYLGGRFRSVLGGIRADNLVAVDIDDASFIQHYNARTGNNCSGIAPEGIRSIEATDTRMVAIPFSINCIYVYAPDTYSRIRQFETDGDVQEVTLVGNRFYIGSHTDQVLVSGRLINQRRLAALDLAGNFDRSMTTWADGQPGIFAIHGAGGRLWLGGTIWRIGDTTDVNDFGRASIEPGGTAPTIPGNVEAVSNANGTTITLTWDASTDAAGIAGYRIVRGGEQLNMIGATTTYVDTRVQVGASYQYHIEALDNRDNLSARSIPITVTAGAPTIEAIADQTGSVGDSVSIPVILRPAGATATFSATGLPDGVTINANTGLISGTITGGVTSTVEVVATTPAGATTSTTFRWEIADFNLPDSVIDTPARGSSVRDGVVLISGTATDATSGIESVLVTVRDRNSFEWLQSDGTFGPSFSLVEATLTNPGATATDWSLSVDLTVGRYAVESRARDQAGNLETDRPFAAFVTEAGAIPDTQAPDTELTTPQRRSTVTGVVDITGTATDDFSGVESVLVSVRDQASRDWLQPDGTFASAFALVETELAAPGSLSTNYSLSLNLANGEYALEARAVDASGNVDATRPFARFTVTQ